MNIQPSDETIEYTEINTHFSSDEHALWCYMNGNKLPCFNPTSLSELTHLRNKLMHNKEAAYKDMQYLIIASAFPNVFNLGGDLDYFVQCIQSSNTDKLKKYAYDSVDLGYYCYSQHNNNITSIALVQGSALGGGFEAALSCHTLIAEEKSQFSFPEINFNLFPGMGAFTYLSRKTSIKQAEEMILSGKTYSANELFNYGIVDIVAKDGEGKETTIDFMQKNITKQSARIAIEKAKSHVMPITLSELYKIADVWVEAALAIKPESLEIMQRLIKIQHRKFIH